MAKKKQTKADKNYGKAKRAFDQVIETWRRFGYSGLLHATDYGRSGEGSTSTAAPRRGDFMADFELTIRPHLEKKKVPFSKFFAAYSFDSIDAIEREVYAQRVLGNIRHSLEQRIGDAFLARGLAPTKSYFKTVRHSRKAGKGHWAAGASVLAPYKATVPSDPAYEAAIAVLNAPPVADSAEASVSSSLGGEQSERGEGNWKVERHLEGAANTQPSHGLDAMELDADESTVTHQDLMFAQTAV